MKSHTVLAVIYVMVAVVQMTEECRRPELCTSVLSIAPVASYPIINSVECNDSHLEVSWTRSTPDGCLVTSLALTYTCFSLGGEVVIDETLLPEDTSTSLLRNLSAVDQSSPIIECELSGHYIISIDECVQVLQPKRVNCSAAEHHMNLPTLASQTDSENLPTLASQTDSENLPTLASQTDSENLPTLASQTDSENSHVTEQLPTAISENSQPYARTTNSSDDIVDDEGAVTVLVPLMDELVFTVVITIESIIATLLMIINVILIIILIIKRGKCQVRRPNSVRNKSEPKSKATDV